MQKIVIIGDLVHSRAIKKRPQFQQTFQRAINNVNARNPFIASPYTITLGDEFQVVLNNRDLESL